MFVLLGKIVVLCHHFRRTHCQHLARHLPVAPEAGFDVELRLARDDLHGDRGGHPIIYAIETWTVPDHGVYLQTAGQEALRGETGVGESGLRVSAPQRTSYPP